jgi:nicotinamide riboside kinase
MLVNFIGSPCSGKTTVAAGVFAELKNRGVDVDFVTERAREYIARKRYMEGQDFKLADSDQHQIFAEQDNVQRYMANGKNLVICDSDPLLTLLYLERMAYFSWKIDQIVSRMGLLVYCLPLETYSKEKNRIHDREFALSIDRKILPHYKQLAPDVPMLTLPSVGTQDRVSMVLKWMQEVGAVSV